MNPKKESVFTVVKCSDELPEEGRHFVYRNVVGESLEQKEVAYYNGEKYGWNYSAINSWLKPSGEKYLLDEGQLVELLRECHFQGRKSIADSNDDSFQEFLKAEGIAVTPEST